MSGFPSVLKSEGMSLCCARGRKERTPFTFHVTMCTCRPSSVRGGEGEGGGGGEGGDESFSAEGGRGEGEVVSSIWE